MEAVDAEVVEPDVRLDDVHIKTLMRHFSEVPVVKEDGSRHSAFVHDVELRKFCNNLVCPAEAQIGHINEIIKVAETLKIQSNEEYENWCDKGSFCKTAINDITETRKRVTRQFDD